MWALPCSWLPQAGISGLFLKRPKAAVRASDFVALPLEKIPNNEQATGAEHDEDTVYGNGPLRGLSQPGPSPPAETFSPGPALEEKEASTDRRAHSEISLHAVMILQDGYLQASLHQELGKHYPL